MAGFLSKREELLQFIPDLQCHKCKNVPGPNGNQNNRYSCIRASHTLCEEHKTGCPCGSFAGNSPSPVIAKLLKKLPWMCQNYKNGCREISMNVEELEHHRGKCIYRLVFCPKMQCQENYGKALLFKDVIDHLGVFHKHETFDYQLVIGKALVTEKSTVTLGVKDCIWNPSKITSSCGAIFFTFARIDNNSFYSCIVFMGSSDEARNYSYTSSVTSNHGEKFILCGPVSTVDKGFEDVIASGSLLSIGIDAVKRSLNEENILEVEITIRNLKEEAKDDDVESGVSDGK